MVDLSDHRVLQAIYRTSFYAFAKRAFSEVEPGTTYEDNWHLDCICAHLEASYEGTERRQIFNVPPRTLKSYLVARAFPAWVMGKNPSAKFIVTSYGHQVAEQNSMACRRIMRSKWYQELFPGTKIRPELDRNDHFETTEGGQYYAATALSPITGIGCFVAGTMVETNKGLIPIESLRRHCKTDTLILSYNHETGEQEYKPVTDWVEKEADKIIEIRTARGREIRCTPDHPIYVPSRGYVRADEVSENDGLYISDRDTVFALPETNYPSTARDTEEAKEKLDRYVLQPEMFTGAPCGKERKAVRDLRHKNAEVRWPTLLFKKMQAIHEKIGFGYLRLLPRVFPAYQFSKAVLFSGLCGQKSFSCYEGYSQSEFQKQRLSLQQGIQESQKDYISSGPERMRSVRSLQAIQREEQKNKSSSAPYRREPSEQYPRKSNNHVQQLPYHASQVTRDTVSSVKRIGCNAVKVYDITVEGNHNYYANGVCVSNCHYMIVDDPIKPMEAGSPTVRESTNENFRATLFSRYDDKRTGRFIMVMQRVHEDDPTGMLRKDDSYKLVKLPAETKEDIEVTLGDKKWGMKAGDLLFPARLSREILDQTRLDMSEYHYVGQYLQEPVPAGGGEFLESWLGCYASGAIKPKEMNICILVDPSGGEQMNKKKRKTSDWSVFSVVGLAPDQNYYLLDMVRDRLNPTERIDTLFMLVRKWAELSGKNPKVGYEKYGMMADTHYIKEKQKLDAYHFPLIELGGQMMKEERIRQLIPDMQNGRWYFPGTLPYVDVEGRKFDLISEIKDEMKSFPRARFDDILDSLSRIYSVELFLQFPKARATMTQKAYKTASSTTSNDWLDM